MSIFDRIKSAIFGKKSRQNAPAAPGGTTTYTPAKPATSTPPVAAAVPAEPVDIEKVMAEYEAESTQKLNWRTSIVDLLKLLDIDSSLENRKELAKELGYTGSTSDSATMNIWLHKQVLRKLQENGGKVPATLLD